MDHEIGPAAFDIERFKLSIVSSQPRAIAFTGKKAAAIFAGRRSTRSISVGHWPSAAISATEVFVLPSPSASARRHWAVEAWHDPAKWLN